MGEDMRSQILKIAKTLVERGWTKNSLANDSKGMPCAATSKEACEWCVIGAIDRVAYDIGIPIREDPIFAEDPDKHSRILRPWTDALSSVLEAANFIDIARYNDEYINSKEEAMQWIDRAIAVTL